MLRSRSSTTAPGVLVGANALRGPSSAREGAPVDVRVVVAGDDGDVVRRDAALVEELREDF